MQKILHSVNWIGKLYLVFSLACLLLLSQLSHAQVSTGYIWSQSLQTYNAGISTTSNVPASAFPTSWDDDTYTAYTLPFAFTYNGTLYPATTGRLLIDSDGWAAFSTGSTTMTGTLGGGSWISISDHTGAYLNGTANNNGLCAFNGDMEEQVFATFTAASTNGSPTLTSVSDFTNIRVGVRLSGTGIANGTVVNAFNAAAQTITMSANATATGTPTITPRTSIYAFLRGIAPYRQFVVQWTRSTRYSATTGDDFSFQLVINEGGGNPIYQTLQAVYGKVTTSNAALNAQVGLRGASAADFNARTTTTNWSGTTAAAANTATCQLSSSVFPVSGLTYTWSPPCGSAASNAGAMTGNTAVCPNSTEIYTIAGVPGAIVYNWTYTGTGVTLSGATTLPTNTLVFAVGATGGTLTVTPSNLCGNGASTSINITVNSVTSASISYPAATYCQSTVGTVSPTIVGPAGGTFSASPAGLTISAAGVITPSTSTDGTYTVTYSYASGPCSLIATTTVAISPNPVISVTATPNLVCNAGSSQLTASADAGGNYNVASIAYSFVAPTVPTTELWGTIYNDETVSGAIPLGFPFTFYGQSISNIYVYPNGYITLGSATGGSVTPQTLPNPATPNNLIALAWDDLEVDNVAFPGAYVRYYVNGTSPNRVMVVDFNKLNFYFSFSGEVTGQIRLYEADNHIEVAVATVDDDGEVALKTLGIENSLGTLGVSPAGRNNADWNATNVAWTFVPKPVTYLWSPSTFLNSTVIRNPFASSVTSTTAYTVRVTDVATGCYSDGGVTVTVGSPLSGVYTVGVGGNYTTLTQAVNAYNSLCLGGPITFSLIDNSYPSETFPIIINNNSYASATNTLTIKPAATKTPLISGSSSTSLIQLKGADYVTIDGSNTVNGITRDLSITNTAASSSAVVWITSSTSADGATNNSIRNCKIYGASNSGTIAAVLTGSYLTAGNDAEAPNNNNTVRNNLLYRAQNGVYARGKASSFDLNWLITQNNIGSTVAGDKMGFRGMAIINAQNFKITQNIIAGVVLSTTGVNAYGIATYNGINTGIISENSVSDVKHTGAWGSHGIYLSSTSVPSPVTVNNNLVFDVASGGFNGFTESDNGYGITISSGSGYKIYFNTAVLNTNQSSATSSTNYRSAAMFVGTGVTAAGAIDLRNNIFENRQTLGGANSRYAMLSTAANTVYSSVNYNAFFNATTAPYAGSGNLLCKGTNATTYNTLATIQTNLGGNANSIVGTTAATVPTYVGASDYHVSSVAANSFFTNLATPIATFTSDYDSTTRNGLTPDIGADEWLMPNTGSWVGKTSIDWLVNTNWETNKIPDNTTDVSITGGYTFMPTIVTTQAVRGLALSAPGTPPLLTINNGTLQIYGAFTRTGGTINASNGTLEMNGNAAQNIPASVFVNNNLKNLVIGNTNATGVTMQGAVDIYRSLTFSAGGLTLNTGGFLTFKSTATETAWLGNVTGKTITGNARIERYIPTGINHGKSWQLLSFPVRGAQSLRASWMENNGTLANAVPGYGTTISSEKAGALGRGYDFVTTPGPSLKIYDAATGLYNSIDNGAALTTAVPMVNKKGYMLLVRGDRSVTTYNAPATATTLRSLGGLYTATAGQVPPSTTVPANKFETVGNLYASAIDFTLLTRSAGVDNTFYVWDPLLPGTNSLGGFQTLSASTGWLPTPGSANYPAGVPLKTIESGQAFFVHGTAGGTIGFSEAAKVAGSRLVNRTAAPQTKQLLLTHLYDPAHADMGAADGNSIVFDRDFSNAIDQHDAQKLANSAENIGIIRDGVNLAIEARKPINKNDTIFYNLAGLRPQQYELRFIPMNLSSVNYMAYLVDRFLNTSTPVSLADSNAVAFTVTSNAASAAHDRFYLVFRKLETAPVRIIPIAAIRNSESSAEITWKLENGSEIESFIIERSTPGQKGFASISKEKLSPKVNSSQQHAVRDEAAPGESCTYRIKGVKSDGSVVLSRPIELASTAITGKILVSPNPVVNHKLSFTVAEKLEGAFQLRLINKQGQAVYSTEFESMGQGRTHTVQLPGSISAGNYQLTLNTAGGRSFTQAVLIK